MKIEKAKNISKMVYIDVILRTSGYGMFIGIALAVLVMGAALNIVNAVVGFLVLILMQGLAQHSLDTIMDQAPVEHSAFRKFAIKAFSKEGLMLIYQTATLLSIMAVFVGVFLIKHFLIIPVFLGGTFCIYAYAKTNIEWYPSFAFALCAVGGYLTQADLNYVLDVQQFLMWNMPICAAFFLLYGIYKIGQVLYRQDDYQREMCSEYQIAYHRTNLRYIHHQTQLVIIALIAAIAGFMSRQPVYSDIALVLVLIYLGIWISGRHKTCNNTKCKNNSYPRWKKAQWKAMTPDERKAIKLARKAGKQLADIMIEMGKDARERAAKNKMDEALHIEQIAKLMEQEEAKKDEHHGGDESPDGTK